MRNFLVLILVVFSVAAFGQSLNQKRNPPAEAKPAAPPASVTPTQPPMSAATRHYLAKYQTASRWNDLDVARDALYDLIVENPQVDSLIFSLGYFYFENQRYASSLLIAQDLLARDAKNPAYLELAGVSAQELGVHDRALVHYENLYLINSNVNTLYTIAFLQYTLRKYDESLASADILLGKPESGTIKVVFADAQGKQKEYPMKVAVINLKGLIALEKGDKAAAKKSFTDALALAPDFAPAKENLEKNK